MREYLPILIVGAIIGTFTTLFLVAYAILRRTKEDMTDRDRHMTDREIISRLLAGESCALVTDAGMPAISDPGADLVALCADRGIPVTSIPGACAFVTALTLSGLDTTRFVFEGFLPVKGKERRERLDSLARETRTFMLHEAPHKLRATLADLAEVLGETRRISLCRELTKLNEDIHRTTVGEAVSFYEQHEPRGEYVLVIEGGDGKQNDEKTQMTPQQAVAYYEKEGMTKTQAIKAAAKLLGIPRNELYQMMID